MDPVTVIGLVEGSISLAVQCGSVAKSLNNIAGQYNHAKLTLSTMVQNLEIMQFAWDRIAVWSEDHGSTDNEGLKGRLERFLETGFLVLKALEEDLRSYDASKMTFHQRSRLMWNEGTLQAHQTRIRDQAQSMSLLLQAIQLPTVQGTAELLQQSQKQFIKSDESAFSIVPSRMSSRVSLSTIQTDDRDSIRSSESLVYRRFSFENDLFTARVYKRNYRTSKYQGSRKQNQNRDVEAVDPRKGNPQSPELANSSVPDQTLTVKDWNFSPDQAYEAFVEACIIGYNYEVGEILKTASTYGGTEALNVLLSRKCDSAHLCPVHATVFGGHLDVMETLLQHAHLEHGENPESSLFCKGGYVMANGHKQRSVPPLHVAAYKGGLSMVQLLLRMGAPINAESDHGVQAIHLAARIGSIKILTALIAAGASVNCRDHKGRQPLHYLSEIQRPEAIHYLVKNGAEINGVSHMSQITPLGLACKKAIGANVEALLSLGALVTGPSLDAAVKHGPPSMVKTLIISAKRQEQGQSLVEARHHNAIASMYCSDPNDGYRKEIRSDVRRERQWKNFLGGLEEDFTDASAVSHQSSQSSLETRALSANRERNSTSASAFSDRSSQYSQEEGYYFANRENDSTNASAFSDLSSQYSQEKESPANRENGSTAASASLDTLPKQSPATSSSDAVLPSEEYLSILSYYTERI